MSYQALVLLPASSNATLAVVERQLRDKLPAMQVSRESETLVLSDGWTIRVDFSAAAHVVVESREIVAAFGRDRADAEVLATADRRFEIDTDPDPGMNRFNDYVLALEALTAFEGAVAFEPQSCTFV